MGSVYGCRIQDAVRRVGLGPPYGSHDDVCCKTSRPQDLKTSRPLAPTPSIFRRGYLQGLFQELDVFTEFAGGALPDAGQGL